jgi:hypothetical protein
VIDNTLEQCSTSFGVTTQTVEGAVSIGDLHCPPGGQSQCSGGYDGKAMTLDITAAPAMSWEILVAETSVWFPGFQPPPADSQLLVGDQFGTGSTTLQTFTVAPDESILGQVLCSAPTAGKTLEIAPDPLWPNGAQVQCFVYSPHGGFSIFYEGNAVSDSGSSGLGPVNVRFTADPSISWEVQISAGPSGIILPELGNQGPVTQDVSVAPAEYGIGSAVLPSFTADKQYTMAFSCSGAGSLTIVIGGVAHTATTLCGGNTGWFTPPNQVSGRPLSLSVQASPGVGWEIQPEQVYGSSWGAGGPNMSNGS